jgi:hypothetical protein
MSATTPADVLNPAPEPAAPATIEDTGLPVDRIHQLIVKTAAAPGHWSGDRGRMRLPFPMLEPLIEHARAERLIG